MRQSGGGGLEGRAGPDHADTKEVKQDTLPAGDFEERIPCYLCVKGHFGGIGPPNFNLYWTDRRIWTDLLPHLSCISDVPHMRLVKNGSARPWEMHCCAI